MTLRVTTPRLIAGLILAGAIAMFVLAFVVYGKDPS